LKSRKFDDNFAQAHGSCGSLKIARSDWLSGETSNLGTSHLRQGRFSALSPKQGKNSNCLQETITRTDKLRQRDGKCVSLVRKSNSAELLSRAV